MIFSAARNRKNDGEMGEGPETGKCVRFRNSGRLTDYRKRPLAVARGMRYATCHSVES
jgi:hypothetical protein